MGDCAASASASSGCPYIVYRLSLCLCPVQVMAGYVPPISKRYSQELRDLIETMLQVGARAGGAWLQQLLPFLSQPLGAAWDQGHMFVDGAYP